MTQAPRAPCDAEATSKHVNPWVHFQAADHEEGRCAAHSYCMHSMGMHDATLRRVMCARLLVL